MTRLISLYILIPYSCKTSLSLGTEALAATPPPCLRASSTISLASDAETFRLGQASPATLSEAAIYIYIYILHIYIYIYKYIIYYICILILYIYNSNIYNIYIYIYITKAEQLVSLDSQILEDIYEDGENIVRQLEKQMEATTLEVPCTTS